MDINLPPQRKPYKSKDKQWRRDCINVLDTATSMYTNENTRRRVANKIINQELYEGKLNIPDMVQMINPYNVTAETIPTNITHHPIVVPKIDLLVGEEVKTPFDWSVIIGDRDGISQKQENRKEIVNKKIEELLKKDASEEELQAEFKRFAIYLKYEWKDIREVRATKLLKHYYRALEVKEKLNEAFKDALIHGEAICQCGIQDGEPTFEKLNPIKVHTVRGGFSSRIEDADVIIIEDHWSPGRIIDTYYDKLTNEEIDRISKGYTSKYGAFDDRDFRNSFILSDDGLITESYLQIAEINGNRFNRNFIDNNGNARVLRAYWSSLKLAFRVKYYDEDGEVQYKIESEEYIADPAKGETIEKIWIREWWHGAKIGSDIWPIIEPLSIQYSRMSNPSKAHPGIIGEVYNTNQGKATSFLDRMKSYQYMYDIVWDRINKALAKNWGSVIELDLAKKPAGWTTHKWISYMAKFGISFIDSFKEGTEGQALGKLAGNFNTQGGRHIDADTTQYISQQIEILEFIKTEMSEIVGVTPQRQGAIGSTETVGGVERSVMQSTNTTAWLTEKHKNFKIRCLSILLETCKIALKGNTKKLQNILDDFSTELFDIDGDEFSEMDYDIFVTSDTKSKGKEQMVDQAAQAFMQNGGRLSTVMDIVFSDSVTEKMRKIELAEQDIQQQAQQQQEQQLQVQQQIAQQVSDDKNAEMQLRQYEIESNNATKVLIEQMRLEGLQSEIDKEVSESAADRYQRLQEIQAEIQMNKEKVAAQRMSKASTAK